MESTNSEGEDYNKNLVLAETDIWDRDITVTEDILSVENWLRIEEEVKHSGLCITPSSERESGKKPRGLLKKIKDRIYKLLLLV
jgi:hypothetical protein